MSNGTVSDLTLKVLENIRDEIRGMRAEMREGFAAVNERIDQTNERIDRVLHIVGTHHSDHEARITRIERHLKLRRKN